MGDRAPTYLTDCHDREAASQSDQHALRSRRLSGGSSFDQRFAMRSAGTETLDMEWVVIAFDERDNALARTNLTGR